MPSSNPSFQLDEAEDTQGTEEADREAPPVTRKRSPTLPPQLGALAFPSSTFGASLVDLLSPLASGSGLETPRPRPRAASRLSLGPSGDAVTARARRSTLLSGALLPSQPTLTYSKPRSAVDERVRTDGKEEDVWTAPFPEENELDELIDGREVEEWDQRALDGVRKVMRGRGYAVDLEGAVGLESTSASRLSDGLYLSVLFLPCDSDSSYEVDILEHLSLPTSRTSAHKYLDGGGAAVQPLVGIVPLSTEWTAVMTERWQPWDGKAQPEEVEQFAKDIVGAVTFLHSHHIAHLALSPSAFVVSSISSSLPSTSPRRRLALSASSFLQSIQLDPLAHPQSTFLAEPLVPPSQNEDGYAAPETQRRGKWDPLSADAFAVGRLLEQLLGVEEKAAWAGAGALSSTASSLTDLDPTRRMSLKNALARMRERGSSGA
ncbi:hypothetical protein JCM10213_008596 [Rhodosporidiobolus nylandii]